MKDLVILAADKNIEASIKGLLARPKALHIRQVSFDIFVHPERDPGCLNNSQTVIGGLVNEYSRALVVFDREGCGQDHQTVPILMRHTLETLTLSWSDRAHVVILDPEIESWVWSSSPHVDTALGWAGRSPDLRAWLQAQGFLKSNPKPDRPKEALEAALRITKTPRSSSIYARLANSVGLTRCTDPSFAAFCAQLQTWFPEVPDSLLS